MTKASEAKNKNKKLHGERWHLQNLSEIIRHYLAIRQSHLSLIQSKAIYTGQKVSSCDNCHFSILYRQIGGQLLKFWPLWEMSAIAAMMRSDWRILRFISALWAGVIRDYAPYPSPFHRHVNHRISISLVRGWEGSGWRPLLVTLGFHDGWGRWRGDRYGMLMN